MSRIFYLDDTNWIAEYILLCLIYISFICAVHIIWYFDIYFNVLLYDCHFRYNLVFLTYNFAIFDIRCHFFDIYLAILIHFCHSNIHILPFLIYFTNFDIYINVPFKWISTYFDTTRQNVVDFKFSKFPHGAKIAECRVTRIGLPNRTIQKNR